jgi:hypothetical protein
MINIYSIKLLIKFTFELMDDDGCYYCYNQDDEHIALEVVEVEVDENNKHVLVAAEAAVEEEGDLNKVIHVENDPY